MPEIFARTFITPKTQFLFYIQWSEDLDKWVLLAFFTIEGKLFTKVNPSSDKKMLLELLMLIKVDDAMRMYEEAYTQLKVKRNIAQSISDVANKTVKDGE